jgi:DNA-entry nuclease
MKMQAKKTMLFLLSFLCLFFTACSLSDIDISDFTAGETKETQSAASLEEIPEFSGEPYVVLGDNVPDFPQKDKTTTSFETYSALDSLGRCTQAYANVGTDLMPDEKRGNISHIKPTGWNNAKYKSVEGQYLFNRCHLIGYQLTGENANEKNLITGTRYMNVEGMLPFENMIADYVEETGNHVLYRVTPVFEKNELVARGVQMEALSVEDDGSGVCFDVFAYNCQPGIEIDYQTGESWLADETGTETESTEKNTQKQTYVINTNTKKFHLPSCSSIEDTKEENKETVKKERSELIADGYEPCGRCKP